MSDVPALQESWYEKLHRWDEAHEAYERKYVATASNPRSTAHIDAALGRLRCAGTDIRSSGFKRDRYHAERHASDAIGDIGL